MRWKTKVKVYPKLDEIRTIFPFAWLPTKLKDGYTVWLERYICTQVYSSVLINFGMDKRWWWKTINTYTT